MASTLPRHPWHFLRSISGPMCVHCFGMAGRDSSVTPWWQSNSGLSTNPALNNVSRCHRSPRQEAQLARLVQPFMVNHFTLRGSLFRRWRSDQMSSLWCSMRGQRWSLLAM